MKKILIVYNDSFMLYRFRKDVINRLAQKYEVVISCEKGERAQEFIDMGCQLIDTKVDRRGINPLKDISLFKTYMQIIKQQKPDVVLAYAIKPNVYCGIACQLLKVPFYGHVQGLGTAFESQPLKTIATILYKTGFRKAKTVFFENQANADYFVEIGVLNKERECVVAGAGINLNEYQLQPYPQNDIFHFLYLGRIMSEKGVGELFDSCQRLKREGYQFILDLVGFYEDNYKEIVEQLVNDGLVIYHGFQNEPRPFYINADCIVAPSYHEGMSNVILEACATGRPVITSNIPGCKEAIRNGVSGLLVEPKNSDDLYEKMKMMLQKERQERIAMGQEAHKVMEEVFDREKVIQTTFKVMNL